MCSAITWSVVVGIIAVVIVAAVLSLIIAAFMFSIIYVISVLTLSTAHHVKYVPAVHLSCDCVILDSIIVKHLLYVHCLAFSE